MISRALQQLYVLSVPTVPSAGERREMQAIRLKYSASLKFLGSTTLFVAVPSFNVREKTELAKSLAPCLPFLLTSFYFFFI